MTHMFLSIEKFGSFLNFAQQVVGKVYLQPPSPVTMVTISNKSQWVAKIVCLIPNNCRRKGFC